VNLILRLALNFICKKNSKFLSFTSIVSLLGIAFGVAAFLVVITILNSFQSELKSIISSTNPNIIIYSQSGINNPVQFEKRLESIIPVPIHSMSRFIYQESVMGLGRQTSAVYIRAIEGTASSSKDSLQKYINPVDALKTLNAISPLIDQTRNTKDDTSTPELLPHVILGSGLAESLNAKIGDTVTLMTFAHENGRVGIRYNKLFVTGFISTGLSEYDKNLKNDLSLTVMKSYRLVSGLKSDLLKFGIKSWDLKDEKDVSLPINMQYIRQLSRKDGDHLHTELRNLYEIKTTDEQKKK
jgi:lipoprotein-releasing system permease protein